MKNSRILRMLVTSLYVLIIIIVVFLAILVFVMFFLFSNSEGSGRIEKQSHRYRHLQFNPGTNSSSAGFISTFEELTGDFLSYQNNEGSYVLISKHGTNEYYCTGVCYCEKNGRRIAQALRSTLFYLVAATSSFLAYNLAKDHFKNECSTQLFEGEICPYASLTFEEDDCEDIFGRSQDDMVIDDGTIAKEIDEGEFNPMVFVNWLCDGHCLTKNFEIEYQDRDWHIFNGQVIGFTDFAQTVADEYRCEDMKLEQIVDFLESGLDIFEQESKARKIFTHTYLALYCEDNSHVRFSEYKETYEKLTIDEIGNKDDRTAAVCLGYERKTLSNPEVYCRPTSKEAEDPFEDIKIFGAGGVD